MIKTHLALGAAVIAATTIGVISTSGTQSCHARAGGALPDPACTPGVIDPRVTQANIASTICRSGYTATVRPSTSVTNRIKRQDIAAYGYADTAMADYELDHLISLELGGAPANPKNLWPESPPSPNPKDRVENYLHRQVCAGAMKLSTAQHLISTNWTTVRVP